MTALRRSAVRGHTKVSVRKMWRWMTEIINSLVGKKKRRGKREKSDDISHHLSGSLTSSLGSYVTVGV